MNNAAQPPPSPASSAGGSQPPSPISAARAATEPAAPTVPPPVTVTATVSAPAPAPPPVKLSKAEKEAERRRKAEAKEEERAILELQKKKLAEAKEAKAKEQAAERERKAAEKALREAAKAEAAAAKKAEAERKEAERKALAEERERKAREEAEEQLKKQEQMSVVAILATIGLIILYHVWRTLLRAVVYYVVLRVALAIAFGVDWCRFHTHQSSCYTFKMRLVATMHHVLVIFRVEPWFDDDNAVGRRLGSQRFSSSPTFCSSCFSGASRRTNPRSCMQHSVENGCAVLCVGCAVLCVYAYSVRVCTQCLVRAILAHYFVHVS